MQSLDLKRFEARPGESLPELLRKFNDKLRFRKNKRQAQIARDAWLDESYVSRLISGERANPSREAIAAGSSPTYPVRSRTRRVGSTSKRATWAATTRFTNRPSSTTP